MYQCWAHLPSYVFGVLNLLFIHRVEFNAQQQKKENDPTTHPTIRKEKIKKLQNKSLKIDFLLYIIQILNFLLKKGVFYNALNDKMLHLTTNSQPCI